MVVFGFWFGSQLVLNTEIPPALAVVSGSMCIPYDGACDGWTHPFDRTLHVGDLIIIQGVDPKTLNTDYPNSDIIVFHRPSDPTGELIVHRIAKAQEINGTMYFFTKGDGNSRPNVWPNTPQTYEYDPWLNTNPNIPHGAVSQDLVVGKVILRIPWIGHIAMIMHDFLGTDGISIGVPIIVLLIIILVIIEFVVPLLKRKKTPSAEQKLLLPTEGHA